MALFGKDMKDLLSSAEKRAKKVGKKAAEIGKDMGGKISESNKQFSESMKAQSEANKEAKAPVEGAIIRYGVIYLGGLADYPKKLSGELGFNVMPESFYIKPTGHMQDKFKEMAIPYDSISKFEIVTRQVSLSESMLANDLKSLEQDNNIEITYISDDIEIVLRLEMLTGFSVAGQAVKCRELLDVLRQNKILDRLNKSKDNQTNNVTVDITEQLQKLNGLKESGILTEEEFNTKKAELLAKM